MGQTPAAVAGDRVTTHCMTPDATAVLRTVSAQILQMRQGFVPIKAI
jgi:hypothetical protein